MATIPTSAAAQEYFSALLRMHSINPQGVLESPELDAICHDMEALWPRMSAVDRERAGGLSEDLYALADGRNGVEMTPEAAAAWTENRIKAERAGPDSTLVFLREPFPASLPSGAARVALWQGQAWTRLGEYEVAYVFTSEAAKSLPAAEANQLPLLSRIGRTSEATAVAERILGRKDADSGPLYQAAVCLYHAAYQQLERADRVRVEARLVGPLRRALQIERSIAPRDRDDMRREARIGRLLAICQYDAGMAEDAIATCRRVIADFPADCRTYYLRGLYVFKTTGVINEEDFERAVECDVKFSETYAILCLLRLKQKKHYLIAPLSARGFDECPWMSRDLRAVLYEMRGIAAARLGQSVTWVEEEFAQAMTCAPDDEARDRIRGSRDEALRQIKQQTTSVTNRIEGLVADLRRSDSLDRLVDEDDRSELQPARLVAALA